MNGGASILRSRRGLIAAAVVLLLVAVAAVVWGLHRPSGDTPPSGGAAATSSALPAAITTSAPPASPTAVAQPSVAARASTAGPKATTTPKAKPTPTGPKVLGVSTPEKLKIPALGIDTTLISLGINADKSVEVPPSPDQVGWFDGSPAPGQLGPSVILGHVSWLGTPAAFYKIGTLKRGDTLSISRADGYVVTFTVQGTRSYPKDNFPTAKVYGNIDYAGLRLITCSGDYDANRHYFPDNLVVYAQVTGVHKA